MKNFTILLLLLSMISCKNDDDSSGRFCTLEFVYGLSVQVRDVDTGGIILNNITVTAIDGSYEEELAFNFDTYIGAGERPGNYTLEVRADGYQDFTSEVIRVGADECHVIPEFVEITLEPL
ncbi:MAG: carboxypeptidase-like regulatory domain-containing protein [Bacteroidota bacterium]